MKAEQTQDWSVTFTYDAAPDEQTLQRVEDLLDDWDGTVAAISPSAVTVTLHVPGDDPLAAVEAGRKVLYRAGVAEMFSWPQIGVEAVTDAEQGRRAQTPSSGP